jgi:hypothetical protein
MGNILTLATLEASSTSVLLVTEATRRAGLAGIGRPDFRDRNSGDLGEI